MSHNIYRDPLCGQSSFSNLNLTLLNIPLYFSNLISSTKQHTCCSHYAARLTAKQVTAELSYYECDDMKL